MKLPASLDWKVRAAIDLVALAAFSVTLWMQDAPGWALTLLVFVALRPSSVALAGDLAAVQTTVRLELSEATEEAYLAGERAAATRRAQR